VRVPQWIVVAVATVSLTTLAQTDPVLYTSIVEGRTDDIATYLDSGGSPDAELRIPNSDRRIHVLELAMRARNEQAALLLLQRGAGVADPTLHVEWAAELGFRDVVALLLDRYPAALLETRPASHPLIIAIANRHQGVAEFLLHRMTRIVGGAELQATLDEALMAAVGVSDRQNGDKAIVNDLLRAGASAANTSVLAGAILRCDADLVSTFLESGADPRKGYDVGRGSQTPVEYAVRCFERADVTAEAAKAVLTQLEKAGANPCLIWNRPELPPSMVGVLSECSSTPANSDR
jgi:hypothetical protein